MFGLSSEYSADRFAAVVLFASWIGGCGFLQSSPGSAELRNEGGPETKGDWDIQPSQLFEPGDGCQYPDCDETGSVSVPVQKQWKWKKTTTKSTCSDALRAIDKRARPDVSSSGVDSIGVTRGTCLYDGSGGRLGTIRSGTMAMCKKEDRRSGVNTFRVEITQFDGNQGEGRIQSLIRGIPKTAGGDCRVERNITYELK